MYHIKTPLSSGLKGEINVIELKIEPDGHGRSKCRCGIEGNLKTLTLNTIEAVHAIYRAMAEDGGPPQSLELFKLAVAQAVGNPRSPVWDLSDDPISVLEGKEGQP